MKSTGKRNDKYIIPEEDNSKTSVLHNIVDFNCNIGDQDKTKEGNNKTDHPKYIVPMIRYEPHQCNKYTDKYVKTEKSSTTYVPDGNWGWFIVLSSFFVQFIIIGLDGCSGILFLKFQERYKRSAAITAWLDSLATALRLTLGPLASGLSNRFSERTVIMFSGIILAASMILTGLAPNIIFVFLSFGILGGIGRSFAYCPAIVMIGMYFKEKQGLATGIAASGCGVGGFALSLLVALLFKQYDFLGAFILIGGITLELIALGALMRPLAVHRLIKDEKKRKNSIKVAQACNNNNYIMPIDTTVNITETWKEDRDGMQCPDKVNGNGSQEKAPLFNFSLLKDIRFLGFCITMLLSSLAKNSACIFLPAFVEEIGVPGNHSPEYSVAIISVFNTLAKIMAGFVFDFAMVKPYRVYLYNCLMFGLVFISFVIPSVKTFLQLAVTCALYGLFTGSYTAQKSVVLVDILGRDKLKHSYGILMMFQGIGTFIGPPIAGLLKDINGRYDVAFYIGGIGMFIGSLIMFINNTIHYIKTRNGIKEVDSVENLQLSKTVKIFTIQPKNIRSSRHSA